MLRCVLRGPAGPIASNQVASCRIKLGVFPDAVARIAVSTAGAPRRLLLLLLLLLLLRLSVLRVEACNSVGAVKVFHRQTACDQLAVWTE
jgi:hypothetical protein